MKYSGCISPLSIQTENAQRLKFWLKVLPMPGLPKPTKYPQKYNAAAIENTAVLTGSGASIKQNVCQHQFLERTSQPQAEISSLLLYANNTRPLGYIIGLRLMAGGFTSGIIKLPRRLSKKGVGELPYGNCKCCWTFSPD
jgi:hypothetical protein